MEHYTEAEKQSPRFFRDYALVVHEIPLWAIPSLEKILDDKVRELDIDGQVKTATVNLEFTTMSFSEDEDASRKALLAFIDRELKLAAEDSILKTRKLPSIAEVEAELNAKKGQA